MRHSDKPPNIQNITPKTEEAKQIRDAFIKEVPIVNMDYSNIEHRIVAAMIKDGLL